MTGCCPIRRAARLRGAVPRSYQTTADERPPSVSPFETGLRPLPGQDKVGCLRRAARKRPSVAKVQADPSFSSWTRQILFRTYYTWFSVFYRSVKESNRRLVSRASLLVPRGISSHLEPRRTETDRSVNAPPVEDRSALRKRPGE